MGVGGEVAVSSSAEDDFMRTLECDGERRWRGIGLVMEIKGMICT